MHKVRVLHLDIACSTERQLADLPLTDNVGRHNLVDTEYLPEAEYCRSIGPVLQSWTHPRSHALCNQTIDRSIYSVLALVYV
jgi:hypothetical protein